MNTNGDGGEVLAFLARAGFAVLMVMLVTWHFSRARAILEKWARDNGFRAVPVWISLHSRSG
jgi:hypothetical protein